MLDSEKLAIAAHLHVLLRRKTGRVTDTEWLAANAEYAAEIIRFARRKALEDQHPDLAEWADKLQSAMAGPAVAAGRHLQAVEAPKIPAAPIDLGLQRYIRGIR
jgi:DNA-binding GntR family transcriptional regulator